MAVYKRSYHQYDGPVTPLWSRFLILPRYAFKNVFRSRWMLVFLFICMLPSLILGFMIYISHNETFLTLTSALPQDILPALDEQAFLLYLGWPLGLAWVLAAFVGPGLVSPDLANNALPLYLCRPFSKAEYVIGKMSVLAILISAVTWIPASVLVLLQTFYEGFGWLSAHPRIPVAILLSSWLWIVVISLLALALSAWVKWRMLAGAMIFVVFLVLAGFSASINVMLATRWGSVINLGELITIVMSYLFTGEGLRGSIPVWAACISLAVLCGICLGLLNRRLEAYEVVR